MPVRELYEYLTKNRERIETEIRQGKYVPQAILGVEIPKSNGKTRLLGIPTVIDRLLQQAVGQVIAIKFEMEFEDYSYGFRPNRNAQQAVLKSLEYINSGYQHIVDIDLKSFPPTGGLTIVSCCSYCIAKLNARSHYALSVNGSEHPFL